MAQLRNTTVNGDLSISGNLTLSGYTTSVLKHGSAKYNYALIGWPDQNGTFYATGFYASSDRRLKENILPTAIDYKSILSALDIKDFNFISSPEKQEIGLIAQDFRDLLPEKYRSAFISGEETEDSHLSINENKLVYIALLALKEQDKEIAELKKEIAKLKARG